MTKGILLDIEGTTTPITFVYDALFPFARKHVSEHLGEEEQRALKAEYDLDIANGLTPPPWSSGAIHYVHWLMDQDRKSTALKNLQGKIWQEGYSRGELHGVVFADVPPALSRWHDAGIDIRIYSSGSVLAQKLLFSTTPQGDLTRFLKGYFDTTTGAKAEPSSYATIARAFGLPPSEILFLSDVTRELDAASAAGLQVLLAVRPGNPPQPPHRYESILEFGAVPLEPRIQIVEATTDQDLEETRHLFKEYAAELAVDLCFQNFTDELKNLPGMYAAPSGCILLARRGEDIVGCVALRPFRENVCEMKRLYVRPVARGTGLGRDLARDIIRRARQAGYSKMVLDTLETLQSARSLYRSLGFNEVDPYYANPLKGVVYMELELSS